MKNYSHSPTASRQSTHTLVAALQAQARAEKSAITTPGTTDPTESLPDPLLRHVNSKRLKDILQEALDIIDDDLFDFDDDPRATPRQ